MGLNLISYPQVLVKQATAPVITPSSLLWRDTDDDALYFNNGIAWSRFSSASDAAGFEQMVAQITLEILRLSAEGTLTAPDYDNMFVDYFADSNGQDNTINTGASTAVFLTDHYWNQNNVEGSETGGIKFNDEANQTKTYTGINAYIKEFRMVGVCGGLDASNTVIKYIDFDDVEHTVATFHAPGNATTNATYSVLDYVKSYTLTISKTDTYCGTISEYHTPYTKNTESRYLTTNAKALSFTPAYALIHVKDLTLNGAATLTYDLSLDGGSTWDSTGNEIDEKILITDGSSKNMIVKFHLTGDIEADTIEFKDYEVLLWSS